MLLTEEAEKEDYWFGLTLWCSKSKNGWTVKRKQVYGVWIESTSRFLPLDNTLGHNSEIRMTRCHSTSPNVTPRLGYLYAGRVSFVSIRLRYFAEDSTIIGNKYCLMALLCRQLYVVVVDNCLLFSNRYCQFGDAKRNGTVDRGQNVLCLLVTLIQRKSWGSFFLTFFLYDILNRKLLLA